MTCDKHPDADSDSCMVCIACDDERRAALVEVVTLRAESERLQSALAEALAANGALVALLEEAEDGHSASCDVNHNTNESMSGCSCGWERRRAAALENPTEAGKAWRERVVAEARKAALIEIGNAVELMSDEQRRAARALLTVRLNDARRDEQRALGTWIRAHALLSPPAPSEPDCATAPKPPMGDAERRRKLVKIDALIAALPPCTHCNSTRKMRGEGFMGAPVVRDCPFCVGTLRPQADAIWAEPDCAPSARPSGTGGDRG